MGRSQSLKLSDVRKVFRLIGELRDSGRDPGEWSRHMADGLTKLVGAKAVFTGEGYLTTDALVYNGFVAVGLTDSADLRGMDRFASSTEVGESRFMQAFTDSHHRRFLATRTNLFDDADWYHSDYYHEYRQPCGLDEWLHSQFHIPGLGGTHMICLSRAPGDCRFTDGERRLLGLFHDELRLVWGDEPPVATATVADEIAALPPRLRETLDRLLVGDSEKQVADRLSVSYHAVHANVKRLHRRFNVSSRGELLAKVNQKPAAASYDFKPRLVGPPAGWEKPHSSTHRASSRSRELTAV